ncbi:hypothetical protein [Methylobacterium oxalidis]|uniref:hypothetical protein n=1 Tax=Methylobacterium oxalidis TaxID=944322 RepID=UPI0033155D23
MKLRTAQAWGMTFARTLVPETETAWITCLRLATEAHNVEYQLRSLYGYASYLTFSARHRDVIARMEQFLQIVRWESEWSALPNGERTMALAEMHIGSLDAARRRLEPLVERYDRPKERARSARFHIDRYVTLRTALSSTLWLMGFPDRATVLARQATEGARTLKHIVSHSNALALAAIPLALWTGDIGAAASYQTTLAENNRRENIPIWDAVNRFFRGAVGEARGEEGALSEMREGLSELVEREFLVRAPMHFAMMAAALMRESFLVEAQAKIEEASSRARAQCERWYLPEVLRIQGCIKLRVGDVAEAENLLLRAIDEAKDIGALSLELRAATSLAEHLIADGRAAEAAEILKSVYCQFTEGFETADLVTAKALLHSLGFSRTT